MNIKNNYRKIGKKKYNNVDANVAQLKRNNNKCYALVFRYNIYIYIERERERERERFIAHGPLFLISSIAI